MKKNNKGFTLIELLVVVAIIGILAAVGVVAYNGYISSAKKSASKAIHNNVMKYIASEWAKCSIDPGASIMVKGNTEGLACSDGGTAIGTTEVVEHLVSEDNSPLEDKNPWSTGSLAIRQSTDFDAGFVSLEASGDVINIRTCFSSGKADPAEDACDYKDSNGKFANRLENSVTIE